MKLKDHYKTLGVSRTASLPEIKKAYRKLALKYHPDKNPDKDFAPAMFRELQDAYSILSDAGKRRAYDEEVLFSGIKTGMNGKQAITPQWIANEAAKLARYVANIDTYRMSHQSLQDYIFLLLSDAHMAVLREDGDTVITDQVIYQLLQAIKNLRSPYYEAVIARLMVLADNNVHALQTITSRQAEHNKQKEWNKTIPYLIVAITLILCLLMYLYGLK